MGMAPSGTQINGGDGIPAELFQILKDDAVKILQSIYQQIWKTQQWPWAKGQAIRPGCHRYGRLSL